MDQRAIDELAAIRKILVEQCKLLRLVILSMPTSTYEARNAARMAEDNAKYYREELEGR